MIETILTWYLKEHAFLLTNKIKGFHQVKDQTKKKNSPQKSNKKILVRTETQKGKPKKSQKTRNPKKQKGES
jgi:hypothetical protein